MRQEKSCGAIVYDNGVEERKYLIIRHQNGGHWAFTKGHVEDDETEVETALREITEEVQLEVELDAQFRTSTSYSPKTGVMKEVVYFVARAITTNVRTQDAEVVAYAWLPYSEARVQLTYDADREILDQVHSYLESRQS